MNVYDVFLIVSGKCQYSSQYIAVAKIRENVRQGLEQYYVNCNNKDNVPWRDKSGYTECFTGIK